MRLGMGRRHRVSLIKPIAGGETIDISEILLRLRFRACNPVPFGLTRDGSFHKANLGHVDRQMPCSYVILNGRVRIAGLRRALEV